MKIDLHTIAKAVNEGLDINTYIGIKTYQDGCEYLYNAGYFNPERGMSLGIINNRWQLTEKGRLLMEKIEGKQVSELEWCSKLHIRLQEELKILTGKKQKTVQNTYSFIPNIKDFTNKLSKVVKKYNLTDKKKIEKLLLQYIKKCHEADFKMIKLLEYYILKNDYSQLATEYENFEEKEEKTKERLIKTEDLF